MKHLGFITLLFSCWTIAFSSVPVRVRSWEYYYKHPGYSLCPHWYHHSHYHDNAWNLHEYAPHTPYPYQQYYQPEQTLSPPPGPPAQPPFVPDQLSPEQYPNPVQTLLIPPDSTNHPSPSQSPFIPPGSEPVKNPAAGSAEEAIQKLNELFANAPSELLNPPPANDNRIQDQSTTEKISTPPIETLIDVRFGENSTERPPSKPSNLIDLSYKPMRPFYAPHPIVYPQPSVPLVPNRFQTPKPTVTPSQSTVTSSQSTATPISLEYKPSRPPYVPDPIIYPEPVIRPETTTAPNLTDRFQETTPTTQINLEYVPSRPSFAPDPVVYPKPVIPGGETNEQQPTTLNPNLSNRNQFEFSTSQPADGISPISLEYQPKNPPYAPDPVIYPQPSIKPGKPWPAK